MTYTVEQIRQRWEVSRANLESLRTQFKDDPEILTIYEPSAVEVTKRFEVALLALKGETGRYTCGNCYTVFPLPNDRRCPTCKTLEIVPIRDGGEV